jgi:nucleolar MIF4G domain-containing protein 1
MSHEPLRVTLDDLHSVRTKGKWWMVGAAWSGDPLVDEVNFQQREVEKKSSGKGEEDKLIKLAKKQGMNTDIRRSVFVVVMSSEVCSSMVLSGRFNFHNAQDYVDACERLGQLRLTEVQQREIIRVLLNCCGNVRTLALICPMFSLITNNRTGKIV